MKVEKKRMEIPIILRDIINGLNITVTAFASLIDFNKSFVCKVFKGEKKLSKNMLNAILICNEIPTEMKHRIQTAYMSQNSEDFDSALISYYIHSLNGFNDYIQSVNIPDVRIEELQSRIFCDDKPYRFGSKAEMFEITTYFTQKLMLHKSAFFYTNYSVEQNELDSLLYSIFRSNNCSCEIDFCHLLAFPKYFCRSNIDIFFSALRWAECQLNTYIKSVPENKCEVLLSPYCIITDETVIIFCKEMDRGVVYTDKASIAFYKNEFVKMKKFSRPLLSFIYYNDTPFDYADTRADDFFFSLSGCLDMSAFLDKNDLAEIIYDDCINKPYIIDYIYLYYCKSNLSADYKIFTTKSALKTFADSGGIPVLSKKFAKPLIPKSREKVLSQLLHLVETHSIGLDVFDDTQFTMNNSFLHEFYKNTTVFRYMFSGAKTLHSVELIINNNEIIGFNEFVKGLYEYLNSGIITLSEASSLRYIQNMIIRCRHLNDRQPLEVN